LINHVGKQADGHIEIALSRRELAQLTGTTLFTVSRLLWPVGNAGQCQREERSGGKIYELQSLAGKILLPKNLAGGIRLCPTTHSCP
jgi:hypothetical protein